MNKNNSSLAISEVDIEFKDVVFKVKNRIIFDRLSCSLDKSSITVILGYNGVGKTAFLRMISGLSYPDRGAVKLTTNSEKLLFHNVTMLFHKPIMLNRSVWSNIIYGLKRSAIDKSEVSHFIREARIEHLLKRPAKEISAGEQQRVAFVRALARRPRVLLLDEPTSNLDPFSLNVIEKLIKKINSRGIKIVMVTHNIEQAERLAGEIIFLQDGRILRQSKKSQFIQIKEQSILQRFALGKELYND
tara:strand:- start:491 stop:1225 length:735 start_codon:yes stop_codon:yes gene_type:complete